METRKRIAYIDSLRSLAIVMVLEGHFITQSLQNRFRDDQNPVYAFWKFTRCLTAPIFLFISGLIFTYLLLKNKKKGFANTRLQKGFLRSLKLIVMGYLLQLNLYSFWVLQKPLLTDLFQIFHILQCIGSSLIIIMLLYLFKTYIAKIPLGILAALLGSLFFMGSPTLHHLELSTFPQFVENIFVVSKNYEKTSVFPLFHWAGFVMFGATLGSVFYQFKYLIHTYLLPLTLCGIGLIWVCFYHDILSFIYQSFRFSEQIVDFSYVFEFKRLGQVLIAIGVFIFLHKLSPVFKPVFKWFPWNQDLFVKMGQNTLSVFVLHVVILYQGFFGWRINELTRKKLLPWQAILGAILFILFFVLWVKFKDKLKSIPINLFQNMIAFKQKVMGMNI